MAKTPSISRTTIARVHVERFRENLRYLRSLTDGKSFFCPMLKADAYGHGDIPLALICDEEKVSAIGVDSLEEALHLREGKVKSKILVFGPFFNDLASDYERHQLTPVISEWLQLEILQKSKVHLSIHIKLNTGMNRKGFREEELDALITSLDANPHLKVEGVLTHLLNGEDISSQGYSQTQITNYQRMFKKFEKYQAIPHIYNSSATLISGLSQKKITIGIRPGIALYGYASLRKKRSFPLKPVLEIHSRITNLQRVSKGEVVSYGPRWTAERESLVGVVPMGYADGYFRAFSNKAQMLIHGNRVPVIGIVCMDYCMIDLTDVKNAEVKVGDEVVILGRQGNEEITAEDLAQLSKSIAYEVLTSVGARIPRIYVRPT